MYTNSWQQGSSGVSVLVMKRFGTLIAEQVKGKWLGISEPKSGLDIPKTTPSIR